MNKRVFISKFNKSIARIEEKCTLCGTCYKTCQDINNIENDCINCGACLMKCPMGAIVPKYNYKKVINYLKDTEHLLSISIAPSVRIAIGDAFNIPYGTNLESKLITLLKKIGFDYVFDIGFSADLVSVYEAHELLNRLQDQKNLPLITSCCPSSVLYMEKYHSDNLNLLSTCKSPVSMHIEILKNYFSKFNNINNERLINVLVVPCVSKKSENELFKNNYDFVLTTTELQLLIKELEFDFNNLTNSEFDKLLGNTSNVGLSFGASTGVINSVIHAAYFMLNNDIPKKDLLKFNSKDNYLESKIKLDGKELKIAVVSGIKNFEEVLKIKDKFTAIEIMTCVNGCVNGAGQTLLPIKDLESAINIRKENILNNNKDIKNPLLNNEIKDLMNYYLKDYDSKISKKLLHRNYEKKDPTY